MSEKQPDILPPNADDRAPATQLPALESTGEGSSLLLEGEAGSLAIPDDTESETPLAPDAQDLVSPAESAEAAPDEEQGLGIIRLDTLGEIPLPDLEAGPSPAAPEAAPPPPEHDAPPMDVGELTLLLMEEQTPTAEPPARAEQTTVEPEPAVSPPAGPCPSESVGEEFLDESIPGALLISTESEAEASTSNSRETPATDTESEITFGAGFEDLARGRSALLLDGSGTEIEGKTAHEPPPVARPKRFWRRRRERIKIVVPKPGTPVQWYSNADACAVYCRKHSRPLLLYFTTGDAEQCHTYEAAIRQPEMQPFLCTYVCCMVNLSHAEGRQVAMRLGVPTDGPCVVLLSPSGREYARILKPEVDWHFLATVLFWALR